ncbi:flavodoxin domain-containing protein [Alkalihalobacterium elongatum]|uniref:flavodoxin domain-containing protein n=1 Tax=Alkalihalobacterium elongatum TaxID=2675466 RepID=UPI001C1FB3A0|nr:flavodoxin domain-containing protein [Alkalihalobacterium elongatum]
MKTAIIYGTLKGTTEKAAHLLENQLPSEVNLINVKEEKPINLAGYDTVILGSSIYAGNVQEKMKKFIHTYQQELLSKKLGLYICCMYEGDKAMQQFEMAYPQQLRSHAVASGLFGGELHFAKMNMFEKLIVKIVQKVEGNKTVAANFSEEAIEKFASRFIKN